MSKLQADSKIVAGIRSFRSSSEISSDTATEVFFRSYQCINVSMYSMIAREHPDKTSGGHAAFFGCFLPDRPTIKFLMFFPLSIVSLFSFLFLSLSLSAFRVLGVTWFSCLRGGGGHYFSFVLRWWTFFAHYLTFVYNYLTGYLTFGGDYLTWV